MLFRSTGRGQLARRARPESRWPARAHRRDRGHRRRSADRAVRSGLPDAAAERPRIRSQSPPGATQPRIIFLPTASVAKLFGRPLEALKPGDAAPPLQGEVEYAGDRPAAPPTWSRSWKAPTRRYGANTSPSAPTTMPSASCRPVEHDSLRAYNTVIRPRGANDTPREPTAEEAARIRAIIDSLRKLRPARVDSIVNGADDDGSGLDGPARDRRGDGAGRSHGPSGRCCSSGTPARSRACRAAAGSPTTRRCRATRSWRRSTST